MQPLSPSERLGKLLNNNVISSSIERRREFKTDKIPEAKVFRRTLKKMFSKEELESFWEEFYSYSEDLNLFQWVEIKFF